MSDLYGIIRQPVFSERTTELREQNKFVLEVDKTANKIEIKKAVEKLFETTVIKVHTCNVKGKAKRVGLKSGRRRHWKKAVITLPEGEKIKLFEN